MGSDNPIAETARRILADLADPQTINRAGDGWKAPAWAALEEAGLTLAWVPEDLGGAGADLADGFAVLREAGPLRTRRCPWRRRCWRAGCWRVPAFPRPRVR